MKTCNRWPNCFDREYQKGKYHCAIDLMFDSFGLVHFAKTKIVSCHTADSKSVKQEVNGTVILPSLVFRGFA
jgi:hypothetical protein